MDSRVNYGQELGTNLVKIAKKLLKNQNLCKLLVNTDLDPLNKKLHSDIEDPIKELFGTNIRIVPLVEPVEETTTSKVIIIFSEGTIGDNFDNESITIEIFIYTPYNEWVITGDNLRPFAIMSEIRKSLQDKRINGLGEITYDGFNVATLTNQMSSYAMRFTINAFS